MTYDDFQSHLVKAGLTLKRFAELLKMNPASISNYHKQNQIPDHLAVIVALMAEMANARMDFEVVLQRLKIAPKKARGAGVGTFGGNRQIELLSDGKLLK